MNENKQIKIWIREDDVSICSDEYCKMIELYKKYNISTVLCAIPTTIKKDCFELIKGSDNFVISQHGYSHKNYKSIYSLDYSIELCDRRDRNKVIEEVLRGKSIIEELSSKRVKILTPPYNRIDRILETNLSKYYLVLSTFGDNESCFRRDLNPSIDIINWQTRRFDKEHFINEFNKKTIDYNDIGICIHHNFLNDDDIKYLDDFFSELSENDNMVLRRRLL